MGRRRCRWLPLNPLAPVDRPGVAQEGGSMLPGDPRQIKGRGAVANPANPFEKFHLEDDPEWLEEMAHDPEAVPPSPRTVLYTDDTQTLITKNTSPDLSF